MNRTVRNLTVMTIGLALALGTGCAAQRVWTAEPGIQSASNPDFDVKLEPLTDGEKFYVSFRLSVTGKAGGDMEIDWNKSLYLHNGRPNGIFVFKDINPEDIKNLTVPSDKVPSGGTFSKVISPYRLLAREPVVGQSTGAGITPGMLPPGENGIQLFITRNGKEVVETLTVQIQEKQE